MGQIQQQSVRTTSVIMFGMVAGVASRLLMPFILSEEQIGVLALLDSVSNLFAVIFSLGFVQIAILLFPKFRDEEKGHHGFLLFGIKVSLLGIILGICTYLLLRSSIFGEEGKVGLLRSFTYLVMPLIFWRVLFTNMDAYLRMLFSSVIGATMESLLMKVLLLLSLLVFWADVVDYHGLVYLYILAFTVPGIALTLFAFQRTQRIVWPKYRARFKEHRSSMLVYGLFGVLTSASAILVLSIDQIMMVRMLSVEDVGVYSVLFFAGMLVNMPGRGVKRIAVPMLSEAWEANDRTEIEQVYQKSSITNMVTGAFLFLVGWACLDDVLTFLPAYRYAMYVFLFIGLGQLVDMLTGVNMQIIATSERYKMNTWFNLSLAALVIMLNFLFIPNWGVVGSAVASFIAMTLVNAARWFYLKRQYGLQAFTFRTLRMVVVFLGILLLVCLIDLPFEPLINVAIYFLSITSLYWGIVLKMQLAPDINSFLLKLKRRFLS